MQATQREAEILQALSDSGSARILDLSRRLNVTGETIRRNVKRLAAQGLVTKLHGGVQLRDWAPEPPFAQRVAEHPEAKRRIARAVAALIPEGAALFLDVGSTTAFVAQGLRGHRGLTVVTNSLTVSQTLAPVEGNRVFMAGGEIRAHDGGAFGAEALAFARQFRLDFAILSAAAVTAEAGFLLRDLREAEFARAIIAGAAQTIMAVDASKFARSAPIRITEPGAVARLVTDAAPPLATARMLRAAGVTIEIAREGA